MGQGRHTLRSVSDPVYPSVGLLPKIMPMLIRGQQEWI